MFELVVLYDFNESKALRGAENVRAAIVQSAATATDKIVSQIVDMIAQHELQAGEQLSPIRELAKLLEQNATAVRDALLPAQALGLVKVLPRAGAFVQAMSLKTDELKLDSLAADFGSALSDDDHDLFHLFDARRLIERQLGGRAIRRRGSNGDWHAYLG